VFSGAMIESSTDHMFCCVIHKRVLVFLSSLSKPDAFVAIKTAKEIDKKSVEKANIHLCLCTAAVSYQCST